MRIRYALFLVAAMAAPVMVQAQQHPTSPSFPANLLYVRSGSAAAPVLALYTRSVGRWSLSVGAIDDPHGSGYREIAAGIGPLVGTADVNVAPQVYVAKTTDGWYAEYFAFPVYLKHGWDLSAFLLIYQPLQGEPQSWQVYLDPVTALRELPGDRFAIGASYSHVWLQGLPVEQAVGPSARIYFKGGNASLTGDYFADIRNFDEEFRITWTFMF